MQVPLIKTGFLQTEIFNQAQCRLAYEFTGVPTIVPTVSLQRPYSPYKTPAILAGGHGGQSTTLLSTNVQRESYGTGSRAGPSLTATLIFTSSCLVTEVHRPRVHPG